MDNQIINNFTVGVGSRWSIKYLVKINLIFLSPSRTRYRRQRMVNQYMPSPFNHIGITGSYRHPSPQSLKSRNKNKNKFIFLRDFIRDLGYALQPLGGSIIFLPGLSCASRPSVPPVASAPTLLALTRPKATRIHKNYIILWLWPVYTSNNYKILLLLDPERWMGNVSGG